MVIWYSPRCLQDNHDTPFQIHWKYFTKMNYAVPQPAFQICKKPTSDLFTFMHPHNYVNNVENVRDVDKDLEKENWFSVLYKKKHLLRNDGIAIIHPSA